MDLELKKQEMANSLIEANYVSNEDELIARIERLVEKVNLQLTDRRIELVMISERQKQEGYEDYLADEYRAAGL